MDSQINEFVAGTRLLNGREVVGKARGAMARLIDTIRAGL